MDKAAKKRIQDAIDKKNAARPKGLHQQGTPTSTTKQRPAFKVRPEKKRG